jgi:NarL family two-component system response regulator LiaR
MPMRQIDVATDSEPTDGPETRLRVVVADGDPLARPAVATMLRDSGRFVVVAEASDGVEAAELAIHYRPELLLTETALPSIDGLELLRRVGDAAPEVRVVFLTRSHDRDLAMAALRRGARGILSKDIDPESLTRALVAVDAGEAAISRALTNELIDRLRHLPEPGCGLRPVRSPLTDREWEVLDLMLGGASTREVADALFLTSDTVYSHVKSILRKLGVSSRAAALDVAQRMIGLAPAA